MSWSDILDELRTLDPRQLLTQIEQMTTIETIAFVIFLIFTILFFVWVAILAIRR